MCSKKRTENFQLTLPEQKISNSLYSSIRLIDARFDNSSVGFIQRGLLNERVTLVTRQPLKEQVASAFTALTDSSAKQAELLLHIRHFSLAELANGTLNQKGYCYLRADLFAGNNGNYKMLAKFDSVVLLKAPDVTKDLLKTGAKC